MTLKIGGPYTLNCYNSQETLNPFGFIVGEKRAHHFGAEAFLRFIRDSRMAMTIRGERVRGAAWPESLFGGERGGGGGS